MRTKLGVLGLCVLTPALVSAQAKDWKQITKPPLRAFQPQEPRRVMLGNGLVLFLQEDHELPLVRGIARIRGGSREEPHQKVGLVSIYGQVWRTGGTKTRTGDQLDDELEARGARLETSGGIDSTTITWDCLSESFDDVFKAWLELLQAPELREDKIPIAKNQLNTGIARRNDDPIGIANREARKLGYGAESPYARVPEYSTVAAVTRDDLVAWHRTYVHPNNTILGVVGDFDSKKMEATLRKALGAWPKGPAAKKAGIAPSDPKPGVYFIQKDDVNQSNIRMVHLGTTRDNPDYHALEVMNEVFGGSFAARLFSNIRSKKGLAYNVGGGVGAEFDHRGLFQLSMGTKSGSTAAGVDALNEEIDNLHRIPATPEELVRAKDAILNSFVFRLDTRQKVLAERMTYEFYGYPLDFLERYRAGIEKVTADDVARVARKYVQKDQIALLVVGKAADFDRPLSSFGQVATLDISIPEGAGPKRAAGAGSSLEAKALLAKVIEGLGGSARVLSVKSVRQRASLKTKTPQGEMAMDTETVVVFPDRVRQQMRSPMGEMTTVVSPEASFTSLPMGTRDLPASQKESALKDLRTSPLYVAQHAEDPKLTVRHAGSEKVGDVETQVLELSVEGAETRWFVDPRTGRVLRSASRAMGMGGPAEQVVDYSDWRVVEGVPFSFKRTITRDGQEAASVEVQELQVNPALDPKLFERPAEKRD